MSPTGRRTSTIVPTPADERMRIAPPCSSVSDLAMARPRPEPWWVLVNWLSTCSNGLPRLRSALFGMPMPVSSIAILTWLSKARARSVMRPPSSVNFTAFDSRLRTICLIMRRSARSWIDGAISALSVEPLFRRARRHHAHRVGQDGVELELLGVEGRAPGLDLRHVEDVVDHVEQVAAALADVAAVFVVFACRRAGRTCRTP